MINAWWHTVTTLIMVSSEYCIERTVESICCTPKINLTLYVNHTSTETDRQTRRKGITSVCENVEKLEPSSSAGGTGNWYSHLEKESGSSSKVKYRVTGWVSNSAPRYITKRNKKHMFTQTLGRKWSYSGVTQNSWKRKPKCPSIEEQINEM